LPDPNNYTTAALPRFVFTNKSDVDDVNGAIIVRNAWDFGDPILLTDTSSAENPSYYYSTDTATYCANLEVTTNHGCINDTTVCVVVGPDLIVFIPNAFTPNVSGPDQNEGFRAIISGEKTMELTIFDRWGEILFQTTEKDEQWNGMYKGILAQQDVYAYQLKVTTLDDELYTYTGTVTLIR
jgi:gliding motility-associated-like protein